jgi:hypothetical protein
MSNLKYCQGPDCHTYNTQDRIKGTKGNKAYQTRRRSIFYYLGGNACSTRCQDDWFRKYGTQAVNHFGRLTEPKKLTEQNAWVKDYDYNWRDESKNRYRFVNSITKEQRPLTEEQYNDSNYTLNTGE